MVRLRMKDNVKKGLIVLVIYLLVAVCVLMTADRVERLQENGFSTETGGYTLKLSK